MSQRQKKKISKVEMTQLKGADQSGSAVIGERFDLVDSVKVSVTAVLGDGHISLKDLFALKVGDVVNLDQMVGTDISLYLENKALARGELVVVDDERFGLKVTELNNSLS